MRMGSKEVSRIDVFGMSLLKRRYAELTDIERGVALRPVPVALRGLQLENIHSTSRFRTYRFLRIFHLALCFRQRILQ